MSFGSIPKLPVSLPSIAGQNVYTIPDGERRLLQFEDIDLWVQPDLGNVKRVGSKLIAAGRKGYTASTNASTITVGTGMENGIATINIPGGTLSDKLPLSVKDYRIVGSYFAAILFRWDAAVSLSGAAYQLFNCGVEGGDDVELYMLNNALYLRHGEAQNATSGTRFAANTSYLVWASYDANSDTAEYGINSASPETWTSELLTGSPNCQRDLVIGGKFNPAGTGGAQLLHGQVRGFWAGPVNWATSDKAAIREAFISEIAALYPDDITLD